MTCLSTDPPDGFTSEEAFEPVSNGADMDRGGVVAGLLRSREPSVRWKTRVLVLGEDPDSRSIRQLREEVRHAPRTRRLLKEFMRPGRRVPRGVYHKWLGCHWALAALADLGYPGADPALRPAMDRALEMWLRPEYYRESYPGSRSETMAQTGTVPCLNGRYRRCASQQGNALFYATTLEHSPESADRLAERLLHWQWPDGGWNCDRNPSADTSAFAETLTPMLGLYVFGSVRGRTDALEAADRASEVFLRRQLFRRIADGTVIRGEFTRLHYPLYWHYDILGGLKALARLGKVRDPRCHDALDLLESKELAGGGWPAERRFYDLPGEIARRGTDRVQWGGSGHRLNEWVTVDALAVLRAAGRSEFGPHTRGNRLG